MHRVAIVGAGPAGLYTAKYLLRGHPSLLIDIYESLPMPFGLIRYGVAPDHPEVKSVTTEFLSTLGDPRVRFRGNVTVGKDISVKKMKDYYNAICFSYGVSKDVPLELPGHELHNVLSARTFVNWYNGHPEQNNLKMDLTRSDTAVIIGMGNVALDCARMLCSPLRRLEGTDITTTALSVLQHSQIRKVVVLGRRGVVQAAFTMKELRELYKMPNIDMIVQQDILKCSLNESSRLEMEGARSKKRMVDFFQKQEKVEASNSCSHALELRFLSQPIKIIPDVYEPSSVGGVVVERNVLEGPPESQIVRGTGVFDTIPCGLVLSSIGYRSETIEDLPFDPNHHRLFQKQGRIHAHDSTTILPRLYCSGWIKRGPRGNLGSNIPDAKETVSSILKDLENSPVNAMEDPLDPHHHSVSYNDVLTLDAHEVALGQQLGKSREKLISIASSLDVLRTSMSK